MQKIAVKKYPDQEAAYFRLDSGAIVEIRNTGACLTLFIRGGEGRLVADISGSPIRLLMIDFRETRALEAILQAGEYKGRALTEAERERLTKEIEMRAGTWQRILREQ